MVKENEEISDEEVKLLISKLVRVGILERVGKGKLRISEAFIDDVSEMMTVIARDRTAIEVLASECRSIDEVCDNATLIAIVITLMEWLCTSSVEDVMPLAQVLLAIMKLTMRQKIQRRYFEKRRHI